MASPHLLALDQGTTSSGPGGYDAAGAPRGSAGREITQHYPRPGWVEHDPEEIWQSVAAVVPKALEAAGIQAKDLAGIGVTNQRETVPLWERSSGKPATRAVVWQDRRTSDFCRERHSDEDWIYRKT